MSNGYFAMIIVFDLVVYALLSMRDNLFVHLAHDNVLFHYEVVWILFTDLLVLGLPTNKRYWWNIYRSV